MHTQEPSWHIILGAGFCSGAGGHPSAELPQRKSAVLAKHTVLFHLPNSSSHHAGCFCLKIQYPCAFLCYPSGNIADITPSPEKKNCITVPYLATCKVVGLFISLQCDDNVIRLTISRILLLFSISGSAQSYTQPHFLGAIYQFILTMD